MSARQRVTILGSTGSIGESTLDVIGRHENLEVFALSANDNVALLHKQCQQFRPRYAVMVCESAAMELEQRLRGSDTEVLCGAENLARVASHAEADTVMAAIVGAAGLEATLAAVAGDKKVLLANKESLVMAGELFMAKLREGKARLLPIDSEHNAIFQCLPGSNRAADGSVPTSIRRIILTASGGPFLNLAADRLAAVTPEQACRHPRWEMGRKISVDSATLMNKGLEFIEACYLFGVSASQLQVVIHPQSIVHSLVEYLDGSMLAQLANPDMRIPIAYGLAWPARIESGASSLDLAAVGALEFREPDLERFPCLGLGMEAARMGGTAPTVLNAANEVAVQSFLDGRLRFDRIHTVIEQVMSKMPCEIATSLDIIREADASARRLANELIAKVN